MNHNNYIGKKLRDLVNDPHFCGGYYVIQGDYQHPFTNEESLNRTIKSISDIRSDCTYWIEFEREVINKNISDNIPPYKFWED